MIGTNEMLISTCIFECTTDDTCCNLLIWNSDESQCFDVIFQQFIGLGSPNLDNISAMAHATSTLLLQVHC